MTPELLVNEHCECGENPLYDDERDVLYWCDIPPGKIFELDLKTGQHKLLYQDAKGREIGAFTLQEDGKLLVLFLGEAGLLDPTTGELAELKGSIVSDTGRFNDCLADSHGRLYAGTVDWERNERGGLFFLDKELNATRITRGTGCSNGLAFTPDMSGLYWCDTSNGTVYLFDLDAESGALSNQRVWLHTPGWVPDGLTIDTDGNLWIAFFAGYCVKQYDANANLLQQVDIPVRNVTSCNFGGANLDQLFITTGGGKSGMETQDGGLFVLKPAVGGKKEFRSHVTG